MYILYIPFFGLEMTNTMLPMNEINLWEIEICIVVYKLDPLKQVE